MPATSASHVAIIGAGISGVVTAAHLKKAGVNVTVFERIGKPGGVWVYDERQPLEPDYPSINASVASDIPKTQWRTVQQAHDESQISDLAAAPPGPCYRDLATNVHRDMMQTTLLPFPDGTGDYSNHSVMAAYISEIVKVAGIEESIRYRTLVENASKQDGKWKVTARDLTNQEHGRETLDFDAVVVANGHYHAPRVPDIPGLIEWKTRYPTRVQHSKSYRVPEAFKGKNVLLIGSGTSSTDIAKEISPHAKSIWQTSRGGDFDFPATVLPANAKRIGDVASFDLPAADADVLSGSDSGSDAGSSSGSDASEPSGAIPGTITLKSGHKLCDIDHVILATGYHVTLPFLRSLHRDDLRPDEVDDKAIVTDGSQYHNLHKDIWYIPDPSLIFIGVPYFTATYSLFEFQAKFVAAVLSGGATLPSEEEMRTEYDERVKAKGFGKKFNSLKFVEVEYVNEILGWVNKDLAERGRAPIPPHTPEFVAAKEGVYERIKSLLGGGRGSQPAPQVPDEWFPAC
ncbi:dimethylaniline monooxygenase [Diplodia corticola]|uniref:Dimethylaniline monooxygenase n=1 Tax=Diplodia corticola TaxID=236234 RepID=A0A1J9QYM2_9PEZI|nr:dimethylaniline monooxygenase [Diplodia corticola]OJD33481.1 dimethylaniline monooxygenase [Diplodia corticola]